MFEISFIFVILGPVVKTLDSAIHRKGKVLGKPIKISMEWGLLSAQVYIETQIQFAALYAGTSCMYHYLRSYHTSLGSLSNGNDNDNDDDDDDDDDNDDDDGSENVAKQGISLKTL